MPRKTTKALVRPKLPDRKYNSEMVQRLINRVMLNGKKQLAERIVYDAIEQAAKMVKSENPIEVFVKAIENGDDLEARGAMLIASNLAGTSFSHSMVGCVHSMAHATGGLTRVPHGVANGILLSHGMEFNFEECKEKYARLAMFMGENVTGLSVDDAARKAIQAVRNLLKKMHALGAMPLNLREAGDAGAHFPSRHPSLLI